MSDSFKRSDGRKVISRASAQEIGSVAHLVVDPERRTVSALVLGKGKRAELVDWDHITGFGPDAVLIADEAARRPPADDRERAAASGAHELVGKRALSDAGTEIGTIDDVAFDPATGALDHFLIGNREIPASALLGNGSYAAVLDAAQAADTTTS